MRRIFEEKAKPLPISKQQVWEAYKKVKSNKGSSGVDSVSIDLSRSAFYDKKQVK